MRGVRASILVVLTAVALPAIMRAQSIAFHGGDIQVNTYTSFSEVWAAIAIEDNGDFVVVWQSEGDQDGQGEGVFGRRFASSGAAISGEFQVNVVTENHQWSPEIATDPDGDFVVVWHSAQGQDGSGYGVFGRRYTSSGDAIGGEFQVNSHTSGTQSYATIGMDGAGNFTVVWQSDTQDGDNFGIRGQRFNSGGSRVGTEFPVNPVTTGNQILPSVALDETGAAVVVWSSNGQDGIDFGVFGRRFDSSGAPLSSDFQVNLSTSGTERNASVGAADDGAFVVAWQGPDGDNYGMFARRFDSAGSGAGEQQVNDNTVSFQIAPAIAVDGNGAFVVVWASNDLYGLQYGVFARRFSSAGETSGPDVPVNVYDFGVQTTPSVAIRGDGAVVVAWQSHQQDGSSYGIFARRESTLATFDADGNGSLTALTDGLLILRYLFGFTGSILSSSAVGPGCTRCDGTSIAAHLDSIKAELDVDGNGGTPGPLTDGLLILRYMFGFTGTTLTNGAVGNGCTRCTAATIEPYLAQRV